MHTPDLYWSSKNIKLYDQPYLHMKGTTFRNNMNYALDFSCNPFAILNYLYWEADQSWPWKDVSVC